MALLAERAGLRRGISMIIDGSLHDDGWYKTYLSTLRNKNPQYNLAIVKIDCSDLQVILQRCEKRGALTGRHIPIERIQHIYAKVDASFDRLCGLFDCVIRINNLKTPQITHILAVSFPFEPWPRLPPALFSRDQSQS